MNERFKFRAWNKEENIMCHDNEDNSQSYFDGVFGTYIGCINSWLKSNWKYIFMQCTGFKDMNKNLVFENDVVQEDTNIAVVKFGFYTANNNKSYYNQEAYGFYLEYISHSGVIDHVSDFGCWEIKGNIYENPELLATTHA